MTTAARVESTDAIKEFRIYLTKFQEKATLALGDADSDLNRITRWLEGEAMNHWTSAIRKRQEELVKAEDALRQKKLFKDASGSTPSAVEEQKAVQTAKRRLAEAQEKLTNVKRWNKELHKKVMEYKGGVSRFSLDVAQAVPAGIAQLGATLDHVEVYLGIAAGQAGQGVTEAGVAAGAAREQSGQSMARAAEEVPAGEEAGIDPAALRAKASSQEAALKAQPAEKGPVKLACGPITDQQAARIAGMAKADPPQRIVISQAAGSASKIFLLRLESAWCVGLVDQPVSEVYNVVAAEDLRAGRPDLAALLSLPVGYLAIVDGGGLSAVFDGRNENVLTSP